MDDNFEAIIARLQQFIEHTGLGFSQFADACSIPRPTLSQLLGGRTKSINDALLSKLCRAFPELDVAWLLFGRGGGGAHANMETSRPQNVREGTQAASQTADKDRFAPREDPAARMDAAPKPQSVPPQQQGGDARADAAFAAADSFGPCLPYPGASGGADPKDTAPSEPPRKVTAVLVLYDDGTFGTYRPGHS